MSLISTLTENIKNNIELLIITNTDIVISKQVDIVNSILNFMFNHSKDERVIFIRVIFLFFLLYAEFINNSLKVEVERIYEYINKGDIYRVNYNILDSVYVLVSSIIDADIRDKSENFLITFDSVVTNNIRKYQKDIRVDYDPYKTPVIRDILLIVIPFFDSFNLYDKIN